MDKVVREGKVAVLYSPGHGAGWSTWDGGGNERCLFEPEIVALVEAGKRKEIPEVAKRLYGDNFYAGGAEQLKIAWLEEGTQFRVSEYDGFESLAFSTDPWHIA